MKKLILLITSVLLAFGSTLEGETITVKGSDTMVILAQRWAEVYMAAHPGTVIQVTGGGSGTGISALINGTTDICNSSRPMKDVEKMRLKQKYGSPGVEIRTAIDGISIYAHPSNPVEALTLAQIKDIYTGRITNWKEVGGPDAGIILYGRENNSGTYAYLKEDVLANEDFARNTQSLPGTAGVVSAISKDRFGVGYGGVAYGKGIKELKVRRDATSPAYAPTSENTRKGLYPISRYLYLYVHKRPTGEIKNYIDWILGKEGQGIAERVGYVPIR